MHTNNNKYGYLCTTAILKHLFSFFKALLLHCNVFPLTKWSELSVRIISWQKAEIKITSSITPFSAILSELQGYLSLGGQEYAQKPKKRNCMLHILEIFSVVGPLSFLHHEISLLSCEASSEKSPEKIFWTPDFEDTSRKQTISPRIGIPKPFRQWSGYFQS